MKCGRCWGTSVFKAYRLRGYGRLPSTARPARPEKLHRQPLNDLALDSYLARIFSCAIHWSILRAFAGLCFANGCRLALMSRRNVALGADNRQQVFGLPSLSTPRLPSFPCRHDGAELILSANAMTRRLPMSAGLLDGRDAWALFKQRIRRANQTHRLAEPIPASTHPTSRPPSIQGPTPSRVSTRRHNHRSSRSTNPRRKRLQK